MYHFNPFQTIIRPTAVLAALLLATFGQSLQAKAEKQQLRFVCVTALAEDQKVIFASRDEAGKWQELASLKLRSRFITEPFSAISGEGSFFVFNFSNKTASVFFGLNEQKIEAAQQLVVEPTLEENGMFRMQVTRPGEGDKAETCYDRYISGGKDSRQMLFLLPDETSGLSVISLPVFVDLD